MGRWDWRWLWWSPLLVAALECVSFWRTQANVVREEDWRRAAAVVHAGFRSGDAVISAPAWTDPLMRHALADVVTVSMSARSDLASFEGLWALSIRSAVRGEGPAALPDVDEQIGPVRVRHWALGPSTVRYDFVAHVAEASVVMVEQGQPRVCPWRHTGFPYPGGLNQGPMTPAERHVCPSRPWLWVGRTVMEDLNLQLRECIWQHPAGREPVRSTFRDVPLGDRIVLYAGLYYGHEHPMSRGPVSAAVLVNGRSIGRLVHRDGDGWKRFEARTRSEELARSDPDARGTITVEVTADNPDMRTLCWTATTRAGPDREVDR